MLHQETTAPSMNNSNAVQQVVLYANGDAFSVSIRPKLLNEQGYHILINDEPFIVLKSERLNQVTITPEMSDRVKYNNLKTA